jgi:two-component system, chemotaxis family, CheB/CheR fusion protein
MNENRELFMTKDVLLVDDDMSQLHLLSLLLESEGFDVTAASNGNEALQVLRDAKFRIVITDFHMPEMNGIELAVRVRKQYSDTDVVLVTADTFLDFFDEAVNAGISRIFKKPVNLKRLVAAIRSSLSKSGFETACA